MRPAAVGASIWISLLVGTALNLINNGPIWWAGEPVIWWKVLMNFVVPFCVASYSAARNEQRRCEGVDHGAALGGEP